MILNLMTLVHSEFVFDLTTQAEQVVYIK